MWLDLVTYGAPVAALLVLLAFVCADHLFNRRRALRSLDPLDALEHLS